CNPWARPKVRASFSGAVDAAVTARGHRGCDGARPFTCPAARGRATVGAMRAMLLCAGLSTRLGRLGSERAKPPLPGGGVPVLAVGPPTLFAEALTGLVINTHPRPQMFERETGDGRRFGARIRYAHEPVILGTGGGLKHALPLLDPNGRDEPFLSINGKLIFDLDVTALVAAYHACQATGDLLGMMVVRRVPDARDWGAVNVQVDARG